MAGNLTAMIAAAFSGGGAPPVVTDPYFDYTTLLLPGNGTNGAQNNTFLDSSTNNFTITRNGNTTQGTFSPFSQTGWGNYFNGSSSLTSASLGSAIGTGDFSMEFFVYQTASAGIITYLQLASANNIYLQTNSGSARFLSDSGISAITGGTVNINSWNHLLATRQGSTVRLFVNGVLVANTTSSTSFGTPTAIIGPATTAYLSALRICIGSVPTGYQTSSTTNGASIFTPPTALLTSTSQGATAGDVKLITCQSNRFVDVSDSPKTITLSGSPSVQAFSPFNPSASWSAATYGGSGYFDGNTDYLKAPANSAFAFGTGDMTFEAWAYYAGTQGTFSYVTDLRVSGSESTSRFYVYLSGTTLYLGFGSTDDINVATGISKDQWLHIAVVRSGSGSNNVAVFVNGTRTHQRTDTSNFSTNAIPTIGARYGNTDFITGYIGSYRIVKGTAVYDPSQSTITVPTAPLTAITNTSLLLNYTNAGIYDATSKNDLETVGNAQISTAISAKWGSGSMAFDGTGDYLLPPSSPLLVLGSADFTIEWWFYANAISGYMAQMSTGTDVYSPIFGISDGVWKIYISSNGSSWDISNGNTWGSFTTGTWDHWAVTRSGSTFRAFKNGVQNSTWTSSSSIYQATNQIALGRGQNNPSLNGYMQDVRITRGYARYTSNFTAPTAAFPTL
jgi:hypothetical protein